MIDCQETEVMTQMKKALIIFLILFILTASIPALSLVSTKKKSKGDELVTIFTSELRADTLPPLQLSEG
jgi:hypothetical protein